MKRTSPLRSCALIALAASTIAAVTGPTLADEEAAYEVWLIDQSDTRSDGGGTLYIYRGDQVSGRDAVTATPEIVDLGGASRDLALSQTGTAPRRPHMLFFNAAHTHAILSFVATGHVLFMNAALRAPVGVVDVGLQAHAAYPSPDQTFVLVADQNGKKLHRIRTDYVTNSFTHDVAATLDLASGTTPSGALREDPVLRPDNAPICVNVDSGSRFGFVTLRGGGMFVVDCTATPLRIVAEHDRATVHPNGCGGVEAAGKMYVNAGGGTAANPVESDLYVFPLSGYSTTPAPPNTPPPVLVFSHDSRGFVDSHGATLVGRGRYLWVADRAANLIVVVETSSDLVAGEFSLVGTLSADPAPDLMDVPPNGNRVFVALRGPNPLTGNAPGTNNAVGATPGLGIVRVEQAGRTGVLQAIAPITHVVGGAEVADPHGIRVRRR